MKYDHFIVEHIGHLWYNIAPLGLGPLLCVSIGLHLLSWTKSMRSSQSLYFSLVRSEEYCSIWSETVAIIAFIFTRSFLLQQVRLSLLFFIFSSDMVINYILFHWNSSTLCDIMFDNFFYFLHDLLLFERMKCNILHEMFFYFSS